MKILHDSKGSKISEGVFNLVRSSKKQTNKNLLPISSNLGGRGKGLVFLATSVEVYLTILSAPFIPPKNLGTSQDKADINNAKMAKKSHSPPLGVRPATEALRGIYSGRLLVGKTPYRRSP